MNSRPPYNQKLIARARELRKKSTPSEIVLWNMLKRKQVNGLQFYRQFPIGNYMVDFFCKKPQLAIEIDGGVHRVKKKEDAFRQKDIESFGISVLRFRADEVEKDTERVVARIKDSILSFPP